MRDAESGKQWAIWRDGRCVALLMAASLTVMANAHRIATEVLAGPGTGPVRPVVELTSECSG